MEKFILKGNIKVRKEEFGCIVLIGDRKSVRFFNQLGYEIMKTLKTSLRIEEVIASINDHFDISSVSPQAVETFINELFKLSIVETADSDKFSDAIFYFEEVDTFPADFYYSPIGVEIEYTNKCARQCDYCSYYSNPFVDITTEMHLDNWKVALDDIVNSGVYYVRFTGGDPFMRPDILEAVQYADDLGLMVSIGSDLTVTKESDFEFLSRLKNFVYLQTTLDGATAETCERFRGKGNFQKVLKGMELMQKYKVSFIVGTVLTRHNVNEIEAIGKLVSQYDTMGYCFSPLYLAGRGIGLEDSMPSNEDLHHAHLQFKKLIEDGIVKSADSAWNEITKDLDPKAFGKLLDNQSYLTRTGERLVRIDPKGHVYVSVKLKRVLVENDEEWNGGNIKDYKLLEVWHDSDDFKKWRNLNIHQNSFGNTIDMREFTKADLL